MAAKRVLILHSISDSITERRIERLDHTISAEQYELRHWFAYNIDSTGHDPDEYFDMVESYVMGSDSTESIERAIVEFQPDTVVVHLGFAFRRQFAWYRSAIERLRVAYPSLAIVSDRKMGQDEEWHEPWEEELEPIEFDNSDEVTEIIRRF